MLVVIAPFENDICIPARSSRSAYRTSRRKFTERLPFIRSLMLQTERNERFLLKEVLSGTAATLNCHSFSLFPVALKYASPTNASIEMRIHGIKRTTESFDINANLPRRMANKLWFLNFISSQDSSIYRNVTFEMRFINVFTAREITSGKISSYRWKNLLGTFSKVFSAVFTFMRRALSLWFNYSRNKPGAPPSRSRYNSSSPVLNANGKDIQRHTRSGELLWLWNG